VIRQFPGNRKIVAIPLSVGGIQRATPLRVNTAFYFGALLQRLILFEWGSAGKQFQEVDDSEKRTDLLSQE
jgi:hypothetical protein